MIPVRMARYRGNIPVVRQPCRPRTCFLVDNTPPAYKSSTSSTPAGLRFWRASNDIPPSLPLSLSLCLFTSANSNRTLLKGRFIIVPVAIVVSSASCRASLQPSASLLLGMIKIYYESSTSLEDMCALFLQDI